MNYLQNLKFSDDYWEILFPFILIIMDIITGYYNAWKSKSISSKRMRDGMGKKIAEIVYIICGLCMSYAFSIRAIGHFISTYVIYMEIVSISENCKKLGLPMPKKIKEKLNNKEE